MKNDETQPVPQGRPGLRRYLAEFVVVFVGVALAFAVENFREDLNERAVGDEYVLSFRQDLLADREMLDTQLRRRRAQLAQASTVLEFFDGRDIDPQVFFGNYYAAIGMANTVPSRNALQEVLSEGGLRLIRDKALRSGLLDLYASYDQIALTEAHMARDFDVYLYDTTFSMVPLQFTGPWADSPENRGYAQRLLEDVRIENGFRLLVANLENPGFGLLMLLESASAEVERLLALIEP